MKNALALLTVIFSFCGSIFAATGEENEYNKYDPSLPVVKWSCKGEVNVELEFLQKDHNHIDSDFTYAEYDEASNYSAIVPYKLTFSTLDRTLSTTFVSSDLKGKKAFAPSHYDQRTVENKYTGKSADIFVNNIIGRYSIFVYFDGWGDQGYFATIFQCEKVSE